MQDVCEGVSLQVILIPLENNLELANDDLVGKSVGIIGHGIYYSKLTPYSGEGD